MGDFADWYEEGWSSKRNTQTKSNGAWIPGWANNLSGLVAVYYDASIREIERFSKQEIIITGFVEMDALDQNGGSFDITEKDRVVSPRGEIYNVKSKENPHNLDDFLKFAVERTDTEKADE